jgi:hypothetical protein
MEEQGTLQKQGTPQEQGAALTEYSLGTGHPIGMKYSAAKEYSPGAGYSAEDLTPDDRITKYLRSWALELFRFQNLLLFPSDF